MSLLDSSNQLLADFCKYVSIEPIQFDKENTCSLVIDEIIILVLELDEEIEAIIVNAIVGKLDSSNKTELLEDMMAANFYWNRTEGGTLGLEAESNILSLCYRIDLPLDTPSDFTFIIEKITNAAEYWIKRINKPHQENDTHLKPSDLA